MIKSASVMIACSFVATIAGCGSAPSSAEENVGEARAAVSTVPSGVGCIEIDVTGARSVTSRTNVAAGATPSISLTGLPLGLDTFVGLAYAGACASVTSTSQATWISSAVQASLVGQQVASVNLTLVPNGQTTVGVGFQPDDGGAAAGAPCSSDASCAAGLYCTPQGLCGGKIQTGANCTASDQCLSGNCAGGMCQ